MKVCALCNYVVTGVHTSGLTNQHKPLRKEEGKEGPLLMVSGQCGRQLLQYVVIVVCEEKCKEEDSGQKQYCSKVDGWWQKHVLGFTLSCFLITLLHLSLGSNLTHLRACCAGFALLPLDLCCHQHLEHFDVSALLRAEGGGHRWGQ